MLLLGGGAGTGKSTVAAALAARSGARRLELDDVWQAMLAAAPAGSPERDVLDVDGMLRARGRGPDEQLARHVAASGLVCARLGAVVGDVLAEDDRDLVVDGAWLLPSAVAGLVERGAPAGARVRAVVVHEPDDEALAGAMSVRRGGARVEAWHADSARLAAAYGAWVAAEARECGVPVVAARPWATAPDRVLSAGCQTPAPP
ncbi:hypothetical protein EDF32_0151 [Cellulomonas sp. PhB143]|nr:hypothetical protein EDF32_0151 [Cellulomonas sp. PhB143]